MAENITKRAPKGNVRFSITLSEEQKLAKAQIRNHPFNFILGKAGENNHTYDFGFKTAAGCSITIDSATPSICNPADNTYSLDVVVSYTNVSGDISINGNTFTPDGTSPNTFTLTGLTADGSTSNSITASSVSDSGCEDAIGITYDAPASCGSVPCPTTKCMQVTINKNN